MLEEGTIFPHSLHCGRNQCVSRKTAVSNFGAQVVLLSHKIHHIASALRDKFCGGQLIGTGE